MNMRICFVLSVSIGCVPGVLPANGAVVYVDTDATGSGNGGGWTDAFTSLSAAITRARPGDEVWVAEGRYEPIELKNGVKIYGGFAGTETSPSQSDPDLHKTYIDGRGVSRVVTSTDDDASTVLRGFNLVNGRVTGPTSAGGGAYLSRSSARFVDCVFADNGADFAGAGVANYSHGSPTFVNCRFERNGAADGHGTPLGGGALFNHYSAGTVTFVNCLFHGNKASEGGAVVNQRDSITFTNCTFVNNEAITRSGGAMFDNGGQAILRNCIVWGNSAKFPTGKQIYNDPASGTTDINHSNLQGGWTGAGNINADPLFVDPAAGDFRIRENSPCRDVGRSEALPSDDADLDLDGSPTGQVPHDLARKPRIYGNGVDMGAYEWTPGQ